MLIANPEQPLRVRPPDFHTILFRDARLIEPFAGLCNILERPIHAEQNPLRAHFADRVDQRLLALLLRRKRGGDAGEYGATTGRPRRVGWFDCVATAYGCRVQGATEAAITNLDVLGYRDTIPVCTAYRIAGETTTKFPVSRLLDGVEPIYEGFRGWKCDFGTLRSFEELPPQARDYVLYIEEKIRTPVRWISVGPRREQIIRR